MKIKLTFFLAALVTFLISFSASASFHTTPDSLPVLNRVAPEFQLKDLNGKTVSLSSYKGKTIVLDFWATWCVYCHKGFPGLQKAISHYTPKDNVVFLFIDTRERTEDILSAVKQDMNKNGYNFNVLLDEKGAEGQQNKVYKIYEMAGLPTEFIIDANGIIRYKLEGYAQWRSDAENAAEIIKLVEKVKTMKTS